jgi:hypothetical protein
MKYQYPNKVLSRFLGREKRMGVLDRIEKTDVRDLLGNPPHLKSGSMWTPNIQRPTQPDF